MSDISGLSSKVALNDPSLAPCTPGRIACAGISLIRIS